MLYRLILGTKPDLSADKREKILEKVKSSVASAGGKVLEVKRRGLTKLAYPIGEYSEMDLVTIPFDISGGRIGALQKEFGKLGGVLRAMIIVQASADASPSQSSNVQASADASPSQSSNVQASADASPSQSSNVNTEARRRTPALPAGRETQKD